ncbi:serine hydrolase [Novosphingobium sp.]|uniref:serine hydrolase n=1 Tax=Novosphingobium sp. TaxID=1874826 RepID=UPI0026001D0F|nr:serine hydrolase [Novosphingobium sp.]MCC6927323.1 serine hydrolase [Novosphingobium sp.]
MTTGLISRVFTGLALATATLVPLAPAHADSLEAEFDKAFTVKAVQARSQLQAPAKVAVKVLPSSESAQRVLPSNVRPFVASSAPRAYGSNLDSQLAVQTDPANGRIGLAAIDLSTGRTVTVLGDTPFPMASTSKVAIVATFLTGVDDGRFSLDASYPLMVPVKSKKYSSSVAPVRAGTMLTGRQLIERTLIHSDNQATDALLAVVGGPAAVNRWLRATGNSGLRLDRDIATLVRDDGEYNPATMIDERDSATPMAMARLLSGLYQGRWLSGDSRALLISTMERCATGKRRMRALLPSDARVAHKTGTLSNTASDVGLVRTPDGRVYAMAIYVTGQGGHAGRDAKIAALARTIYDGYQYDSSGYRVAAQ